MSLLADLLSKVKTQGSKRDVPPGLKQIVENSAERAAKTRRIVILSVFLFTAVISGVGSVYLFNTFIKKLAAVMSPVRQQPGNLIAVQSTVLPAPAVSAPAPAPPSPPAQVSAQPQPAPIKTDDSQKGPDSRFHGNDEKIHSTTFATSSINTLHKKKFLRRSAIYYEAQERVKQGEAPSIKAPVRSGEESAPVTEASKQISREERENLDMYLYAATNCEARKDYKQALANYTKVLGIEPGNYIVMNNVAGIMLMMGRDKEALQYARTAFNLKKDYALSLINMGIASIKLNNAAEGEGYLTSALTLDPSNRNALLNLAILHEKNGAYDKSYTSFYRLAEAGDIQGYLGLARIAEKKGKKTDAERIYREILSMNNIDPNIKKLAGERLQAIGKE